MSINIKPITNPIAGEFARWTCNQNPGDHLFITSPLRGDMTDLCVFARNEESEHGPQDTSARLTREDALSLAFSILAHYGLPIPEVQP
jgi:hypothetical protein